MSKSQKNTPVEILDGAIVEDAAIKVIIKFTEALNYNNSLMEQMLEHAKQSHENYTQGRDMLRDMAKDIEQMKNNSEDTHSYVSGESGLHSFFKDELKASNKWIMLKATALLSAVYALFELIKDIIESLGR